MMLSMPPVAPTQCEHIQVSATTYNVPMFLANTIDLVESVTRSSKGLSWYDGSEIIAYRELCNNDEFLSLLRLTGMFPVRDNYGETWSKYEAFKYNDVVYRLVPVPLMNSINYFINHITLPNLKQE